MKLVEIEPLYRTLEFNNGGTVVHARPVSYEARHTPVDNSPF